MKNLVRGFLRKRISSTPTLRSAQPTVPLGGSYSWWEQVGRHRLPDPVSSVCLAEIFREAASAFRLAERDDEDQLHSQRAKLLASETETGRRGDWATPSCSKPKNTTEKRTKTTQKEARNTVTTLRPSKAAEQEGKKRPGQSHQNGTEPHTGRPKRREAHHEDRNERGRGKRKR